MTTKECRICYETEKESNSKLIYPCRCNGTSKYIHVECLEKWRDINKGKDAYTRCLECLVKYHIKREFPKEKFKYNLDVSNEQITGFLMYNLVIMSLAVITPNIDIERNIPELFFTKDLARYLHNNEGIPVLFYYSFISFVTVSLINICLFLQLQLYIYKRTRYWKQAFCPYLVCLVINCHFLLGHLFSESYIYEFYIYITSFLSLFSPLTIIYFMKTHNDIIYYLNNVRNKYKIMNYKAKKENIILAILDNKV